MSAMKSEYKETLTYFIDIGTLLCLFYRLL